MTTDHRDTEWRWVRTPDGGWYSGPPMADDCGDNGICPDRAECTAEDACRLDRARLAAESTEVS